MGERGEPTGAANFNRLWPVRGDYTITIGPERHSWRLPWRTARWACGTEVALIAVGALVVAYGLWLYAVRNRK